MRFGKTHRVYLALVASEIIDIYDFKQRRHDCSIKAEAVDGYFSEVI